MKESSKPNDMFLATLNKPDATELDLLKNDINLSNTLLLSRDEYKETPMVKKVFTKDGVFDDASFNRLYDLAQYKYEQLDEDELMLNLSKEIEYSPTAFFRPLNGKVADASYTPYTNKNNPLHQATGLEGLNYTSEPEISAKEAAQQGRIWDPVNQKWLDETAESRNIFKKAFGESLVYAKYTQEGWLENPITKEAGYHKKGEYITDELGNYFTQLAGSMDLINGTEIVKLSDILTKEGSVLNHVDFFDSDGLDKSVFGTAMKTLVSTGIYFVPYIGTAYTAASIIAGLGSNLPLLYKSVAGLFGDNVTQVSPTANKLINYFSKFDKSMSDYGSEHFWSFENLGGQVSDIIGLLYQQRSMAKLSTYLKPFKQSDISDLTSYTALRKEAESRGKLAKGLSLGYMAITLAGLTYNDALEGGYDQKTAGIATLLTTAALFGIMNFNEGMNGLGTWFLDKTTGYDRDLLRAPIDKAAKKVTREIADILEDTLEDQTKGQRVKTALLKFANKADDYIRIGGEGIWKGFINEGVEEVSEEVIQDGIKGMIDGLTYLGLKLGWYDGEGSFGGWSNVFSREGLERYMQTFIGGALGGALFDFHQSRVMPFVDLLKGIEPPAIKLLDLEMVDIALRGLTADFMKALDLAGKFISNRQTTIKDSAGKYKIAENGEQTLRDVVVLEAKNRMVTIDKLVKQITQGGDVSQLPEDYRAQIANFYAPIINNAQIPRFIERRFQKSVENVASKIKEAANLQLQLEGEQITPDVKLNLKEQLDALNSEIAKDLKYTRNFFSGLAHIDTFTLALFLLNPAMREYFINGLTEEEFYENVLKGESSLSYHLLLEKGLDKMSKEKVHNLYTLYINSDNSLDTLIDTLPLLLKTFDSISDLISTDLAKWGLNILHQTVIRNAIEKMKQDYDARAQAIKDTNYALLLQELMGNEEWSKLSNEEKAAKIEEMQQEAFHDLAKEYSIDHLMDLIKNNPKAFSNLERYSIDYASLLFKDGIIRVDNDMYDPEELELLKLLINVEFVNAPFTRFNELAVRQLISNVNKKLADETNSFRKAILEHKREKLAESNSLVDTEKLGLVSFETWNPGFEVFKLKSLEEYLGDEPIIFLDIYDYIYGAYQKMDAANINAYKKEILEFVEKYKDIDGVKETVESYLTQPQTIILALDDLSLMDERISAIISEFIALVEKYFGEDLDYSETSKLDEFAKNYKDREKVTNPFKEALTKVYFSLGGSNMNVINFLAAKTDEIIKGEGDSSTIPVNDEVVKDLARVAQTLQLVNAIASMMAPTKDFDGKELSGINQLRKELADSLKVDSSKIATISYDSYDLFETVLLEVSHLTAVLGLIYGSLTEDQNKQFENIRKKMIENSYRLFKYHCELDEPDKKDPNDILKQLFNLSDIFTDGPLSLEELLAQVLTYRQKLHEHIRELLANEEFLTKINKLPTETAEQALIRFLVDYYAEEESLYYYGDTDLVANDTTNDDVNTLAQYWLNEVVSLIGENSSPKKISQAIHDVFVENKSLYPRQDQIKVIELAVAGVLNRQVYIDYGKALEDKYATEPKAAVKQYVNGLIRIPGPSGSGKTTLYSVIVNTLEKLGVDSSTIAVTAKAETKVLDLAKDLEGNSQIKTVSTLNKLITGLEPISSFYEEAQSKLINAIQNAGSDLKNVEKEGIEILEHNEEKKYYLFAIKKDGITIKFKLPYNDNGISFQDIQTELELSNDKKVSLNSDINVIFVDECTNLSPVEWNVLNGLPNVAIIATGDTIQRGYKINVKNGAYIIGDENQLGFNTPSLISVHRCHNNLVKENELQLRRINDTVLSKLNSHAGLSDFAYSDLNAIDKALLEVTLKYYLGDKGFYGAQLISENELAHINLTNSLAHIDKSSSILGIASTSADLEELGKILESNGLKNVRLVLLSEIQGAEADYAIAYKLPNLQPFSNKYREIYTLVTRGRKGFIAFENKLFTGIKSELGDLFYEITRSRLDTDAGNRWLDSWGNNLDLIQKTETKKPDPTKSVESEEIVAEKENVSMDAEEIDKATEQTPTRSSEEDKEENSGVVTEEKKKQATTIKSIIGGDGKFAMVHLLGYLPEVGDFTVIDREHNNVSNLSEEANNPDNTGSFWNTVRFLLSTNSLNNIVLEDIRRNGRLLLDRDRYNPKNAYIYTVNALTENLKVKKITLFSIKKITNLKYYLKPNDDVDKNATELLALCIPLTFDDVGNISSSVVIGTIGRSLDENGESSYKGTIIADIKDGERLFNIKDNYELEARIKRMEAVYGLLPRNAKNYYAIFPITGIRPFYIENSLESNKRLAGVSPQQEALLALNRWEIKAWLAMGWEYVQDSTGEDLKLDLSTATKELVAAFFERYRYLKLSSKGAESLSALAGKTGYIYVMKPIGASNLDAQPILIKSATDWLSWLNNAYAQTAKSNALPFISLSTYHAKMLLSVLAKRNGINNLSISDLHPDKLRDFHEKYNVEEFNFGNEAYDNDKWGFELDTLNLLFDLWKKIKDKENDLVIFNMCVSRLLWSGILTKLPKSGANRAKNIGTLRDNIVATDARKNILSNFAKELNQKGSGFEYYAYTSRVESNSPIFIERVYERPNLVIDISGIEEANAKLGDSNVEIKQEKEITETKPLSTESLQLLQQIIEDILWSGDIDGVFDQMKQTNPEALVKYLNELLNGKTAETDRLLTDNGIDKLAFLNAVNNNTIGIHIESLC